MFRPYLASCLALLIAASLHAGEVVVEERPFAIEATFDAGVMPDGDATLLTLDAKTWKDFRFAKLADHGSVVHKGDLLASFDSTGFEHALEDTRRAVTTGELNVAKAEQELTLLKETAPHRLAAARRAAENASEENAYFTKTRRKAEEENADEALARQQQQLSNQMEELRQLTKMYQADDITEETEEIILTRQKDDVTSAQFAVRMETLKHKRKIEVMLPREAIDLANNERDTAIAQRAADEEIPRSIELKKLELESLKSTLARDKESLANLEQDRRCFEFLAKSDGCFYHGPISDGLWKTGELIKALVTNGSPPIRQPFATFIPTSSKLAFVAFLDEATARPLKSGLTGTATFAGREDVEIPVNLTRLAGTPEPNGSYRVSLSATWPKDFAHPVGSTAQVRLISYQQAAAILVPTKALAHDSRGWTVEIMLADGKTDRRPVKRGRVSKEETEILSGLDIGQVIITP